MIIATAGHVDHGKTSLVHALTGIDTDRLADEKRRGLTIDLGFAYTHETDQPSLGFVDVPGHIRFINNMLAGVSGIDHALLIVAADDGVMPQTREHLDILQLLEIKSATIAVTKIDRVATDRVQAVQDSVKALVADSHMSSAEVYCVSATTGEGVRPLQRHLLETAEAIEDRKIEGHFRLAIDRCFSIRGSGLVVTGSIFAGTVSVGDELVLAPAMKPLRVRGLHAQNMNVSKSVSGDRCAVNISGLNINKELIHRGDWLIHSDLAQTTTRFDAKIRVLPHDGLRLKHLSRVHIHSAASHVTGRIVLLEKRLLQEGETSWVQIMLDAAMCLCHGDRFVIRDQSAAYTIAGGRVVDPFAPARGRAHPTRLAQLQRMAELDREVSLSEQLEHAEFGINLTQFARARNLLKTDQHELFGKLVAKQIRSSNAGSEEIIGFTNAHWQAIKSMVITALIQWHAANPGSTGALPAQFIDRLPALSSSVFDAACNDLIESRQIVRSGAHLQVPGHSATLSKGDAALWDKIRKRLEESDLKPPVNHELAKQVGIGTSELEQFIKRTASMQLIVRVTRNRIFLPTQVAALQELVLNLHEQGDGMFSASEFRDISNVGRNLAIEILEYFDRSGLTLRVGDRRKVVNRKA